MGYGGVIHFVGLLRGHILGLHVFDSIKVDFKFK